MTAWTFVDEPDGALLQPLASRLQEELSRLSMSRRSSCCVRPTMRVFEMVGSELVTTPTVSMPARSRDRRQLGLLGVVAPEAGEKGLAAEAGEVHGDVGRAAGALIALRVAEHRHRSLGRDALDVAVDVAVEHDVADHQHLELG